ncbi:hypothetical protein SCYAM73S_01101 [Streptomyces cyaneofuscatus]
MIRPRLSSTIERRLLVNYRVDPSVAAALLPAPLRPQLVRGQAVAGICLLRIGGVRPGWAPAATGVTSENAAHRISVEWDGPDGVECGVYIPRRDTASRLNAFAGGRIYPGEHGRADLDHGCGVGALLPRSAASVTGTAGEAADERGGPVRSRLAGSGVRVEPDTLIAFRALMGLAGATLLPSALAVLGELFADPRQRAQAIGIFAAAFAAGFAIGPAVGGSC